MAIKDKKLKINPYILVIVSFLLVILVGSFLLNMPFARTDTNKWDWGNYVDSFTTAVSATCVTGTCTYEAGFAGTMTIGGQIVTLFLIQIGGLGFITVLTFIITLFKQKLQFKDRYFISQMVSSTNFADVVKFVRRIIVISFVVELFGFLVGLPVFLHMFKDNIGMALWYSLFHSVSAFNNAGFDLFGNASSFIGGLTRPESLVNAGIGIDIASTDWRYYYFCSYILLLVILGGISFLVIIDVVSKPNKPSQWRAFTKIALLMGAILHIGGAGIIYLADGFKGSHSINFFNALFQSVTCRTAGFSTYWQDDLSIGSKLTSCLLMLIGGAPLGTAGGLKTTTIFMVIISVFSYFKGSRIHAFKRAYSNNMVIKAMSLIFISAGILVIAYFGLSFFGLKPGIEVSDITYNLDSERTGVHLNTDLALMYFYSLCSNFGTVGLFVGIEPFLSIGSKLVICFLMFAGRLGPMTFFQIFQTNMDKEAAEHFKYIEEDFLIG